MAAGANPPRAPVPWLAPGLHPTGLLDGQRLDLPRCCLQSTSQAHAMRSVSWALGVGSARLRPYLFIGRAHCLQWSRQGGS